MAYAEAEATEGGVGGTPRGGIAGEPEPLSEKALREASAAVDVFGEALVRNHKTNAQCVVIRDELI